MRRRFSNDLVPDEAVLNRIRARRKFGRKLLVVEGQTDVQFVKILKVKSPMYMLKFP